MFIFFHKGAKGFDSTALNGDTWSDLHVLPCLFVKCAIQLITVKDYQLCLESIGYISRWIVFPCLVEKRNTLWRQKMRKLPLRVHMIFSFLFLVSST